KNIYVKFLKINKQLLDNPKIINYYFYDNAWIFEIEIADLDELKRLINPQDYQSYVS
ncbi:glycine cleavage system protein H, partial [Francisella tularensis subsp. holarctica]|nr:glycine cleavage system protein H [Francisella tularensis subsp. holarctica]